MLFFNKYVRNLKVYNYVFFFKLLVWFYFLEDGGVYKFIMVIWEEKNVYLEVEV